MNSEEKMNVWEKERLGRSLYEICARKEWEREIGHAWEEEWSEEEEECHTCEERGAREAHMRVER
jgi:hypothetical protein